MLEYTFDSISGSTITDTSGRGNHGTTYNNITYAPGLVGNCICGDGVSARVDLPTLNLANKTFCAYVKLAPGANDGKALIADGSAFTHGRYLISIESDRISVAAKGTSYAQYYDRLTDNNFYCAKHTGNACKIRRNAENWTILSGDTGASVAGQARMFAGRGGSNGFCTGTIDQFRVYDRELEEYEVDNIYNNGAGC